MVGTGAIIKRGSGRIWRFIEWMMKLLAPELILGGRGAKAGFGRRRWRWLTRHLVSGGISVIEILILRRRWRMMRCGGDRSAGRGIL